jgi:hypothetical protein
VAGFVGEDWAGVDTDVSAIADQGIADTRAKVRINVQRLIVDRPPLKSVFFITLADGG